MKGNTNAKCIFALDSLRTRSYILFPDDSAGKAARNHVVPILAGTCIRSRSGPKGASRGDPDYGDWLVHASSDLVGQKHATHLFDEYGLPLVPKGPLRGAGVTAWWLLLPTAELWGTLRLSE